MMMFIDASTGFSLMILLCMKLEIPLLKRELGNFIFKGYDMHSNANMIHTASPPLKIQTTIKPTQYIGLVFYWIGGESMVKMSIALDEWFKDYNSNLIGMRSTAYRISKMKNITKEKNRENDDHREQSSTITR